MSKKQCKICQNKFDQILISKTGECIKCNRENQYTELSKELEVIPETAQALINYHLRLKTELFFKKICSNKCHECNNKFPTHLMEIDTKDFDYRNTFVKSLEIVYSSVYRKEDDQIILNKIKHILPICCECYIRKYKTKFRMFKEYFSIWNYIHFKNSLNTDECSFKPFVDKHTNTLKKKCRHCLTIQDRSGFNVDSGYAKCHYCQNYKNDTLYTEKKCFDCKNIVSLNKFHLRKDSPDGRNKVCMDCCLKESQRKWKVVQESCYDINCTSKTCEKHYDAHRDYIQKQRDKPCAKCGNHLDVLLMDFDHIDPITKFKNVAAMVNYSIEIIDAEIAKCQVLCIYCHKEKDYLRRINKPLPKKPSLLKIHNERLRRYKMVEELKNKPCYICNKEKPHYHMEFDHLPEFKKLDNVSKLVFFGFSDEIILAEIAKTKPICCECHRLKSLREQKENNYSSRNEAPLYPDSSVHFKRLKNEFKHELCPCCNEYMHKSNFYKLVTEETNSPNCKFCQRPDRYKKDINDSLQSAFPYP